MMYPCWLQFEMNIFYYVLVSSILLSCCSKHLAVVKQNGKLGAIEIKGTFVIEAMDSKLTLKLNEGVIEHAKKYAKEHNISLSRIRI